MTGGDSLTVVIQDPTSAKRTTLSQEELNPALATEQATGRSQSQVQLMVEGKICALDRYTLEDLADGDASASAYLNESGFAGDLMALHRVEIGGQAYLYGARSIGEGIGVYELDDANAPTHISTLADSQETYLKGVSALTSTTVGGKTFLISVSCLESGVSVHEIRSTGQLVHRASLGAATQLPIDRATGVDTVEVADKTYVLVSAFGTSSLSVLELTDSGQLSFVDQVADTLDTRFEGAAALDTISVGGQVFVAVAGNDGGVSLFQLLPGGRLVLLDSFVDGTLTALDAVRQLCLVEVGNSIELMGLSARDAGLTRMTVDLGPIGVTGTGVAGSNGRDVLTASANGGTLSGQDGDDILIEGSGRDTLQGGSGSDLFILRPDEGADTLVDFNRTEDRIDLSAFETLDSIKDLVVQQVSGGAVLRWGKEELHIRSHDGARLAAADFEDALIFSSQHVVMPPALPSVGGNGNDRFIWSVGADTVDGGQGNDLIDYAAAPSAIRVDLADSALNAGAAAGDQLRNIEGVKGSDYNDTIRGTDGGNTLAGGKGNDLIEGRGGWDWINPGAGSDMINGGAGTDMVAFDDLSVAGVGRGYRIDLDLETGRVTTSGRDVYQLNSVERVTGTIAQDRMKGSAGDDLLRGIGDYDWFRATTGNDTIDGGSGLDMISFLDWVGATDTDNGRPLGGTGAPPGGGDVAGVVVDLADASNNSNLASSQALISIEQVTGSSWQDVFYGDGNTNNFRGMGGYDWFVGSAGGRERYYGGAGIDTMTYYQSTSGVAASLRNGAKDNGRETGSGSRGDALLDLYFEIENLVGTHFDDHLTGNSERNVLNGLDGDDFLFGYQDKDTLRGGRGSDVIDGGSGSDTALFDAKIDAYTITKTAWNEVRVVVGSDSDLLSNVEYFQFADTIISIWDL